MVLADLGADVLRIDRPSSTPLVPDAARPDQPERDGPTGAPNPYDLLNRNRLGIGVDLRSPDGTALVRSLAASADVVVEGYRPGVAERFGLGPDDLLADNPRLVYGRMTGWGQSGPLAPRAGHDLTYLALAGVLAHVGRADQPPTPPLNLVADFGGGGMLLAMGVLAALVERATSGAGQVVDAAMVDGAALLMAPLFGAWASGFWSAERGTNLLDSGAPFYDCYRCADGGWLAVAAIEAQFYAELLDGLGLAAEDLPGQHDQAGWPQLRRRFTEVIAGRPRDEWAELFADRDACVAPVLDMGEAPGHPHAVARGAFVDVHGVPQPAAAPRFSRTPAAAPAPARTGSDPAAVLRPWGVDGERVSSLVAAGVLS
ncbi:CaiB/BaiF CoA transferase family protein [Dermatobacter hominis]|uniref:CaiB/BaiF CoA transferase family protein n=1 Tax=Dermatobacter hominis TaxID=2884263 RepID=UPI0035ABEBB2